MVLIAVTWIVDIVIKQRTNAKQNEKRIDNWNGIVWIWKRERNIDRCREGGGREVGSRAQLHKCWEAHKNKLKKIHFLSIYVYVLYALYAHVSLLQAESRRSLFLHFLRTSDGCSDDRSQGEKDQQNHSSGRMEGEFSPMRERIINISFHARAFCTTTAYTYINAHIKLYYWYVHADFTRVYVSHFFKW